MIKNVYIYTDDYEKDYYFRQEDIQKNGIAQKNVFTDISFENAYKTDVSRGVKYWDTVRMINRLGEERIYKI